MGHAEADRQLAVLDPAFRLQELEVQAFALRRQRDELVMVQAEDEVRDHVRWAMLERPFK